MAASALRGDGHGLYVWWHGSTVCAVSRRVGCPCDVMGLALQEVHAKLLEEVDDEHIPVEYGGRDARHLYETDQEVAVWRLADKLSGGQS